MKRDMELVRKLLLYIEDNHKYKPLHSQHVEIGDHSKQEIGYHLKIMAQGDLIDVQDITAMGHQAHRYFTDGITWCGHDFLDAVRDDNVWSHTKEAFKPVGSASFEVVKSVAIAYVSSKLGPS
ncbi:MAG: DUF2513 domain-containing protein [Armatimonadota bacterium]|nr:DUF2513 domain-containing protein [Armatimonadota bacterium]